MRRPGLSIAIGIVDDLDGYAERRCAGDPVLLGHQVRNGVITELGAAARRWLGVGPFEPNTRP